jgi:hypothetical protein
MLTQLQIRVVIIIYVLLWLQLIMDAINVLHYQKPIIDSPIEINQPYKPHKHLYA